jgi:hypothetical protein
MEKTRVLFVVVSGLVGLGIVLSFYGNQIMFEDLSKGEEQIKFGENLTIEIELDNTKTHTGIYAIQIMNFKEKTITATIIDPFGMTIKSQLVSKESFEERFEIITPGLHKLIIENSDNEEKHVFGVIGPEPDAGKKSLVFVSFYIIIIGLIGMVIVAIYLIKNRRKSFS